MFILYFENAEYEYICMNNNNTTIVLKNNYYFCTID